MNCMGVIGPAPQPVRARFKFDGPPKVRRLTHPTGWSALGYDDSKKLSLLDGPLEKVFDAARVSEREYYFRGVYVLLCLDTYVLRAGFQFSFNLLQMIKQSFTQPLLRHRVVHADAILAGLRDQLVQR